MAKDASGPGGGHHALRERAELASRKYSVALPAPGGERVEMATNQTLHLSTTAAEAAASAELEVLLQSAGNRVSSSLWDGAACIQRLPNPTLTNYGGHHRIFTGVDDIGIRFVGHLLNIARIILKHFGKGDRHCLSKG